jgi:hypothetical protein
VFDSALPRTFRDNLEAEIPLENHNFALYWSLPYINHNVLYVLQLGTHMELVPMAEFTIVTRSSSSAWIPELIAAAGPEVTETYIDFFTSTIRNRNARAAYARACWQFLIGAPLMAWSSRPSDRSMWLLGLRTFLGPNRPSPRSMSLLLLKVFYLSSHEPPGRMAVRSS